MCQITQVDSVCYGMIDLPRMLQSSCRLLSLQQVCIVVQHLYHIGENLQCHVVVFHLATRCLSFLIQLDYDSPSRLGYRGIVCAVDVTNRSLCDHI